MNNRQDKSPTLDYEELQRRHAAFKERKRLENLEKRAPAEPVEMPAQPVAEPAESAAPDPGKPEDTLEINFSEEEPEEAPAAFDDDIPVTDISGEEFSEEYDEASEEDYDEADAVPGQNPNPFDSFFSVFSRLKGKFSRKKRGSDEGEDAYGDYESEFSEDNLPPAEDYAEGEYAEDDYADDSEGVYAPEDASAGDYADDTEASGDYAGDSVEEVTAPRRRFSFRRKAAPPAEDYAVEDVAEDIIEDVEPNGYAPVYSDAQDAYDEGYEEDADEAPYEESYDESYEDYADEDYGDDFEAEPAKKIGKFGRFIRLFVVPVEEDGEPDAADEEADYYDDGGYSEDEYDYADREDADYDEYDGEITITERTRPGLIEAEDEIEGGLDNMADLNRINPELSKALAADLENPGMSRRERRELAERLAAEEAARKAEEAKAAAAEAAKAASEPVAELFTEEPLEADVVTDVSSGIVEIEETAAPIDVSVVDEPTREFKPVSKMSFDEYMDTVEETDEDEEAEEEEAEEAPVRRGLFGRRKAKKVVEEEEEYDDEDEEDDYEDEEDDEEEEIEEKPRRGLFGRRKAKKVVEEEEEYDDEDEEDDYDDYDDYDDEDEEEEEDIPVKRSRKSRRNDRYDDEDDYDDDYDDEYEDDYDDDYDDEDDYDEGGSSFGRSILRFFTVIISLVLIAAIVLLSANILNVIDVISLTPLAERMPEKLVDVLLFSEKTKQVLSGEVADEADALPVEDASQPASVEDAETVEVPEIILEDIQDDAEAEEPAGAVEPETASEPTVG